MTIQRSHAFLPVMADSHSNSPRLQGESSFALLFAIRSSLSFFIVVDSHWSWLIATPTCWGAYQAPPFQHLRACPLARLHAL